MDACDIERLKKLSQQGAAHYQAEEDFMNLPVLGRSKSAPTSSLAVRYERLRATHKGVFQRQPETQPSTQPENSGPVTSSHLSPLARCATAPQMRVPTRIVVQPAAGAEPDTAADAAAGEADALAVPDVSGPVPMKAGDAADSVPSPGSACVASACVPFAGAERPADFEVPDEARARLSKKRGSDPAVLYVPEVKKLRKKKKKGFFRRHMDSYGADSGASGGDSDATTHSTHSSVSEPPPECRPRSWTRRMTDAMSGIFRKR